MNANDRTVDHRVFEIRFARQGIENPFEHAFLRPPAEPHEHRVPWTELIRQIAPRHADPDLPKDRLKEETIVLGGTSGIAVLTGQQSLQPFPLIFTKNKPNHPDLLLKQEEPPTQTLPKTDVCQRALVQKQQLRLEFT